MVVRYIPLTIQAVEAAQIIMQKYGDLNGADEAIDESGIPEEEWSHEYEREARIEEIIEELEAKKLSAAEIEEIFSGEMSLTQSICWKFSKMYANNCVCRMIPEISKLKEAVKRHTGRPGTKFVCLTEKRKPNDEEIKAGEIISEILVQICKDMNMSNIWTVSGITDAKSACEVD